jgi:hypothetical protein
LFGTEFFSVKPLPAWPRPRVPAAEGMTVADQSDRQLEL